MKKYMVFFLWLYAISFSAVANDSSFVIGPYLKFLTPQTAAVYWRSKQPAKAIVEIKKDNAIYKSIPFDVESVDGKVVFNDIELKTKYTCQVNLCMEETEIKSATFEIDSSMNYTKYSLADFDSPFAKETDQENYAAAAKRILQQTNITKGYCLVYGCVDGRLAYELAKNSDLTIIGVDEDEARIQKIRQRFMQCQLYGVRFSFIHCPSLSETPLPNFFANLVVSERMLQDGNCIGRIHEIVRVLRPAGGTAYLGTWNNVANINKEKWEEWLRNSSIQGVWEDSDIGSWVSLQRPALPETGSWTHQYGNPSNSSNSGDTLLGASQTGDLQVQWMGRPGADFGLDRNPRMPSPLEANSRLFHQGMNRMAAIDAYNGTILWTLEIPNLRRVNMPRDASNWCADDDFIYAAISDKCWKIQADDGDVVHAFSLPTAFDNHHYDWGYVANQDNMLMGSCIKKGSVYTEFFGNETWYDAASGYGTGKICSDLLFAYDINENRLLWQYRQGFIINTTIAMDAKNVYFIESRHPALQKLTTNRIEDPELWLNQCLVALNAKTGEKMWEKSIDTHDGIVVFYLSCADSSLLVTSSGAGTYHMYSFNAENGDANWHVSHPWPSDNHGGHMQHPAIANHIVYLEPCGYDLKTGERVTDAMGRHSGCATYAAASEALIYRGDSRRISLWSFKTGEVSSWYNLRPSCWLSVIPADGMILAPEGGGGCSCGNWLETSVVFSPIHAADAR